MDQKWSVFVKSSRWRSGTRKMGECPIKSINRTALYDAARGGLESGV